MRQGGRRRLTAKAGSRGQMPPGRAMGILVNILLRVGIAAFLIDVLRRPEDKRYAGKAIPVRNLIIVGTLSFLFPLLFLRNRRRWQRFPVWSDNIYLSIFWLDMAGNFLDLYDRYFNFDLIPHFHGSGALAAALLWAFGWSPLAAIGTANAFHGLLEAQEIATDAFCGTRNVRGWWDSAGDLIAGLLGTLTYVGISQIVRAMASE